LAILNFEVMVMIFWFKSRSDEFNRGAFSKVQPRSKENKTKNESDICGNIWVFSLRRQEIDLPKEGKLLLWLFGLNRCLSQGEQSFADFTDGSITSSS